MFNLKSITLMVLLAFVSMGCGTDGLNVDEPVLSFSNTDALSDADYVQAGQQYNFTVQITNGPAAKSRLTAYTANGDWLNAQLVNNGNAIQLSGTPNSAQAGTFYTFYLTGADANGLIATTSFGVYVDN